MSNGYKTECPSCSSSDGFHVYPDGHGHCFVCNHHVKEVNTEQHGERRKSMEARQPSNLRPTPTGPCRDLPDRAINAKTASRFNVTYCGESGPDAHLYPYYDGDGNHIANKVRKKLGEPRFVWEGNQRDASLLFGQTAFPKGSAKQITITEGECDAMAVYQMMGDFPVVSVRSASTAVKDVRNNYEYLNSFDQIVVAFDKDEAKLSADGKVSYPGQEAAEAVARLFSPGKCRVLTPSLYKDANDYLMNKKVAEFKKEWWAAPAYTPAGLVMAKDLWDDIANPPEYETIPYPWQGLEDKTFGLRLSELVVVTAKTGIGKTSILKELEHHVLSLPVEEGKEPPSLGLMHLEEPNRDTAMGLMSITANKPLHLPCAEYTKEELREYFDVTLDNDRVIIWDHFGSNDIDEVLAKVEHMHVMGCKYIVVDHLSIIVSDQKGDERKQLDEITTKLKTKCMELNIAIIAVVHLSRSGEIRGTAGIEQLANLVIRLERDNNDIDDWRRNVTKLTINKNRFSGQTGPACWLHYELETGRLKELTPEEVQIYEAGQTIGEEWPE